MQYISTRGKSPPVGFEQALLGGLAEDGGLYIPESFPALEINPQKASFEEISAQILNAYVGDFMSESELAQLVETAYRSFSHSEVAPVRYVKEMDFYLLELFYGPTLAFKDIALQLVGHLFEAALNAKKSRATILTATSGDTGAAAIHACLGKENLSAVILHPRGRVSDIQRKMMTSVMAPNIQNIAIDGDFDDCQDIVKGLFQDADMKNLNLAAMNSINWARIAAQTAYYFHAAHKVSENSENSAEKNSENSAEKIVFCVPTGNFGNIYSGWVAAQMGAPVSHLISAVNTNDSLVGFIKNGEISISNTQPSLAPAMDVSIPSNLERLIFYQLGADGSAVSNLYGELRKAPPEQTSEQAAENIEHTANRRIQLDDKFRSLWDAYSIEDSQGPHGGIRGIIQKVKTECGIWIDPHTAVGVGALLQARKENPSLAGKKQIVLSTAHPSKFEELYAGEDDPPQLPDNFKNLKSLPENYEVLPADLSAVKNFILNLQLSTGT